MINKGLKPRSKEHVTKYFNQRNQDSQTKTAGGSVGSKERRVVYGQWGWSQQRLLGGLC